MVDLEMSENGSVSTVVKSQSLESLQCFIDRARASFVNVLCLIFS